MAPDEEAEVTDDYFLGDKKMSMFAVSMSLVASFISALTTLGYPPEGQSCLGNSSGGFLSGVIAKSRH